MERKREVEEVIKNTGSALHMCGCKAAASYLERRHGHKIKSICASDFGTVDVVSSDGRALFLTQVRVGAHGFPKEETDRDRRHADAAAWLGEHASLADNSIESFDEYGRYAIVFNDIDIAIIEGDRAFLRLKKDSVEPESMKHTQG